MAELRRLLVGVGCHANTDRAEVTHRTVRKPSEGLVRRKQEVIFEVTMTTNSTQDFGILFSAGVWEVPCVGLISNEGSGMK